MWIEYDCNDIGQSARWVTAQSNQYQLPDDVYKKLNDSADPFTVWPKAAKVNCEPAKLSPIKPFEALKKVGERVQVDFHIVGAAVHNNSPTLDLYSESTWRAENCLTLRIWPEHIAKFNSGDSQQLLQALKGKTFRATGIVQPNPSPAGERPFIEITDPIQMKPIP
jgi:hypothetical protein